MIDNVASVFCDMVYNGPDPSFVELTGLNPGEWYDLCFYERGWDFQGTNRTYSLNYDIGSDGSTEFSTTNETPVTLAGTGWVDVHEIRLSNGSDLNSTWTTTDDWQLALGQGVHPVTLEAYDRQGNLLGSDSITITITRNGGLETPNMTNLVISEIYYNPSGQDESTEFIELRNVGDSALDLSGTRFTAGIDFTFPEGTTLAPDRNILVVANRIAFAAAYDGGFQISGEFENGTVLSNGGELITLQSNTGTNIQSFTYDDDPPWPTAADGDGFSLVLLNPVSLPDHSLPPSWRASSETGGNPGTSDECPAFVGDANAHNDYDDVPALIEHFKDWSAPSQKVFLRTRPFPLDFVEA